MGGLGSGEYDRDNSKIRVEACLTLGVGDLRGQLSPATTGTLVWRSGKTVTDFVVFDVIKGELGLYLALHYRLPDAGGSGLEGALPCPPESYPQFIETREVHFPIRLQETRPAFGGKRWWLTCPLTVNGVACNRRVGKLYLPPDARYFGCRHCYDLTYRSCQQAHQNERSLARAERLTAWLERQYANLGDFGRVRAVTEPG